MVMAAAKVTTVGDMSDRVDELSAAKSGCVIEEWPMRRSRQAVKSQVGWQARLAIELAALHHDLM